MKAITTLDLNILNIQNHLNSNFKILIKPILLSLFFSSVAFGQDLPTVPVTTKPLSEVLIERKLTANAQVVAPNNTQISAEITAVVDEIYVDVGDAVTAGEVLINLDALDANLLLDQAKANSQAVNAQLKQAELRLTRAKELKTYISSDDLLSRETDVAVLRADLLRLKVAIKTAQRQVDKTTIKAPFNGVVSARQAQKGQLVTLASPLLNLVQITASEVTAKIPSRIANTLIDADKIEFIADNQTTDVELLKLSPVIDQQAALQMARFKPLNSNTVIGQTGQLAWYLKGQLLSADLVVKRQGKLGVFTVQNNKAKFIVLPEAQEGRPAVVQRDVNWQVIIGGRERLQDGQSITQKTSTK